MRAGNEGSALGNPELRRSVHNVMTRESGKNPRISGFLPRPARRLAAGATHPGGMNGATAEQRTRNAGGSDACGKCADVIIETSSLRRRGALCGQAAPRPARERRSAPWALWEEYFSLSAPLLGSLGVALDDGAGGVRLEHGLPSDGLL